jgi:hypothetical protein
MGRPYVRRVLVEHTGLPTGFIVEPLPPRRKYDRGRNRADKRGNWVSVWPDPLIDRIIAEPRLTVVEHEVWHALTAVVGYEVCFEPNLSAIARRLHRDRSGVDRAFRRLVAKGMVVAEPSETRCYWLNPQLAWKGYEEARIETARELRAAR